MPNSSTQNFTHAHGIRVVLDGVFNHVGRGFWAFRDVQEKKWEGPSPRFCRCGLRLRRRFPWARRRSPGDRFDRIRFCQPT